MPLPESLDFYWLVGLLEGEGSFMSGPPSNPNSPLCRVEMTDQDIVDRAANMWAAKTTSIQPRQPHHKPSYAALIKGPKAVSIMKSTKPFMSEYRQEQIRRAIRSWAPPKDLITYQQAQEIRRRNKAGDSHVEIARSYKGIDNEYVRAVVRGIMFNSNRAIINPWV